MRKINTHGDGELLETIFVFQSKEEREDYFREGDKRLNESQAKSLSELRSAFLSNSAKIRNIRGAAGRQNTRSAFGTLHKTYSEEIKKVHDLYAKARAKLRIAREKSLLESDLKEPNPA